MAHYNISIGYNGAAGAGGDEAVAFDVDACKIEWFAKTAFIGLKETAPNSGYLTIRGAKKHITIRCNDYNPEPNIDTVKFPEPKA